MTTKEKRFGHCVADKIYCIKQFEYLGIDKTYTGYFMLIDVVNIVISQNKKILSFSMEVYPLVASRFDKNVYTIERNIRNLIDKCWCEELRTKLNATEFENKKPTCKEFIYLIIGFILNQIS